LQSAAVLSESHKEKRMRITALLTCCVGLLLGSSRSAHADPVIVSGYYVIGSSGDLYQFNVPNPFVVNPGSLITGSASSVAGISQLTCLVCDPGQTYEIGRETQRDGFPGKTDLGTGTELSGSFTREYAFSGWLTFLADPITLPAAGSSSVSFAVPFAARVSLDGRDLNHPGGGIFTRWVGTGTAHVTFTPTGDGRWVNNGGEMLRFEFSAEPVPEPATFVLIASGLAGIAAARRRRAAIGASARIDGDASL
jgi:hypothetical protein